MADSSLGEATTTRKDYLKLAYESLEEGTKNDLQGLRDMFDKDTKKAIDALTAKKPDHATKLTLNAIRQRDYHRLTVGEKGDLQRWALASGKRLDSKAIDGLSSISAKLRSQGDTQAGASNDGASMSLDEVLLVCGERKEIAKHKTQVFNFLGKEVNLNSLWTNLVETVDKLKPVGDTASSTDQTAGLVWGIFKVLLQFAVLSEKGAEAALCGIQTAADVIQRAATYEKHIYNHTDRKTLDKDEIQPFETCLISTYQRVFKFFITANKCFTKNKASLCWYVFWSAGDILEFEKNVFKYEQSLFRDATIKSLIDQGSKSDLIYNLLKDANTSIQDTQQSTQGVLAQQSEVKLRLDSLNSSINNIQVLIQNLCPDVSRDQMLCWFSTAKVKDHHRAAKDRRTKNTARWILKRPEYVAWSSDPGPSLLWIKGISGAGKTTVVSRLVDKYHESAKNDQRFAKPAVAYFYCKRDAADRRFSENIFRSLIRQLASAYHPLPERLVQTYREKSPQSSLSTKLYKEDYEALLIELIPRTTETVLILDALDECIGDDTQSKGSSNEIEKVLETFKKLLKGDLPVKIVVASRYDSRIDQSLKSTHKIEILARDNSSDIREMVLARIKEYNNEARPVRINEGLKEKILEVFYAKSEGKFQWATLHIDHILDGLRERSIAGAFDVEQTLGKLPEGLVDTYKGIIHHIDTKLNKRQKETAFRVFKWLLAMGTCDETVLIAATCQRLQGQPEDLPDPVEGDAGFILTACQHLVTIQDSEFRFSHLSVQEYLEAHKKEDIANTCHYDVAKVCASVLFLYRVPDEATHPWVYFCRNVGISPPFARVKRHSPIDELWYFSCRNWYGNFMEIRDKTQQEDIKKIIDDSQPSTLITWLNIKATEFMMDKSIEPSLTIWTAVHYGGLSGFSMTLGSKPNIDTMRISSAHMYGRKFSSREVHAMGMDEPQDVPLFSRFPIGSRLLVKSPPVTDREMSVPHMIELVISCGVLSRLQRLIKRNMTDGTRDNTHCKDGQGPLNKLFKFILESKVTDGKDVMHDRPLLIKSGIEALELEYETREQEEFLTLCTMFISWRQAATNSAVEDLSRYEHLFSALTLQDEQARQCYGELARLMLLFLSLDQTLPFHDQELGDFLFNQFPDVATIQYQYLSRLDIFDLDAALVTAAMKMDRRYLHILLSHGANIHAATSDGTPLVAALSCKNFDNAEFLRGEGARMDDVKRVKLARWRGYGNVTIMAFSIQERSLLDFLFRYSDIDKDAEADHGECRTPLIAACRFCHVDRVSSLLSMGVDLNRTFTSGPYLNTLCAAVQGQSIRTVRQLLQSVQLKPWELKDDALLKWRNMYQEAFEPNYHDSIPQKCQDLPCWLTLAFLHCIPNRPQDQNDEGQDDGSEAGGHDTEDNGDSSDQDDTGSDDSGDSDGSDQNTTSSGQSEDDMHDTHNFSNDDQDGDEESEPHQDEDDEENHFETEQHSDGEIDGSPAQSYDVRRIASHSDTYASENIRNLISWLYQHCRGKSLVVRHELARTFGFTLPNKNDEMASELQRVHYSLISGFYEVLTVTNRQVELKDIVETWARFLDCAETCLNLPDMLRRPLSGDGGSEIAEFNREIDRLANGGM